MTQAENTFDREDIHQVLENNHSDNGIQPKITFKTDFKNTRGNRNVPVPSTVVTRMARGPKPDSLNECQQNLLPSITIKREKSEGRPAKQPENVLNAVKQKEKFMNMMNEMTSFELDCKPIESSINVFGN